MRDKNQNIQLYLSSLEKELKKVPKRILDLRNQVAIDPNFSFEYIQGLPRKKDELFSLILLSKWFPEELRAIFFVELEGQLRFLNFQDRKELIFLLSLEKEETLYYLTCYPKLSDRDFFGNILPKGRKILEKVSFQNFKRRKPKFTQRKRGYNDHSSRRPDSKWLPSSDFSFTEEQRLIEIQRDFLDQYTIYLRKLLSKDISLIKQTENLENEFPVDCILLRKSNFFCLLYENWNEEGPLKDYLRSLIEI